MSVVLADMAMETHGGVADTIANLSSNLQRFGISPVVLLHNPVNDDHSYVRFMRQQGVTVWAVPEQQKAIAVAFFRLLAICLWPVVLADSIVRRKRLTASRQSVWGVLRRVGFWGLRVRFFLYLLWARLICHSKLAHFFKPDMWPALRWMKLLGFRTLYTEETDPSKEISFYYDRLRQRKAYIDGITAVSAASAQGIQLVLGVSRSVPVIPNMVDVNVALISSQSTLDRAAEDSCTVALVGRLSPQKNIETFLLACQQVVRRFPNVDCVIHGDGPERKRLLDLSKRLDLTDAVRFPGAFPKEELSGIMADLDVVVLSSLWEGFGISLLEAMAFAKPVVATAVGGVPDVVDDGVTGILVPPRAPDLLANAICRLIADPDLRHTMGQAGHKRYQEHFTPASVVPQYVKIYRALTEGLHR